MSKKKKKKNIEEQNKMNHFVSLVYPETLLKTPKET